MMSIGAVGAIFLSSIYPHLFYIIVILMIISIALFLFFFKDKRSKILFTKIVKSRIFASLQHRIEGSVESFYEDLPKFKDAILPFGISIFGWFLKYSMFFLIAKMFLIEIPYVYFIMVMAVADVIASIPISIYGLGTREVALITMFNVWGIEKEPIVSLSLFWFVIVWLTPSLIGAVITFFETKNFDNKFVLTDNTVKKFESYMRRYPKFYQGLAEIVKKNISKKIKKPIIVDIGVGPGILTAEVKKKVPEAKIFGVDPSDKMLKAANKNVNSKDFQAMLGTSEKIPLQSNFADVVLSRFSLTYWKKPVDSFLEIKRVLKPGGRLVLEALNKDYPKLRLFITKIHMNFKLAGDDLIKYHVDAYKTAYRIQDVERILKKSGFKITFKDSVEKDWKFTIVAEKLKN